MLTKDGKKLKLPGLDGLLGVPKEEVAVEIELNQIQSFKNHPFKVLDDDKMQDLVESIRDNGVLCPVLVRPIGSEKYEMISGHRRMHAANLLHMELIPAFVRNMTDEEAVVMMVDSNIQREELLPSEKAFAYKMKLEAMKKQGIRNDLFKDSTSAHNERRLESADVLGDEVGISRAQIRRYIRLTELIPELLDLVDRKTVSFVVGVDISYIDKEIQEWLYSYILANGSVTPKQIKELREEIAKGVMTQQKMVTVLNGQHKESKAPKRVTITEKKLRRYLGDSYTVEEMEDIIFDLLKEYKNRHNEQ